MMRAQAVFDKRSAAIAMTMFIALGLSSCSFANTSSTPPSDPYTNALYNALNNDRARNGLPALTWSPKLANQAGTWANQMSDANMLYHQNLSALLSSPNYAGY